MVSAKTLLGSSTSYSRSEGERAEQPMEGRTVWLRLPDLGSPCRRHSNGNSLCEEMKRGEQNRHREVALGYY